jgi:hypothetical protein
MYSIGTFCLCVCTSAFVLLYMYIVWVGASTHELNVFVCGVFNGRLWPHAHHPAEHQALAGRRLEPSPGRENQQSQPRGRHP